MFNLLCFIYRIVQGSYTLLTADVEQQLQFFPAMEKLLVDGCETLTAVLGMTGVISMICHYIGRGFQWYLMTYDNDEEKSLGTVSAVLFYILALQTGLTSLSPDKRFVRLCRNLCLLVTALFHFLHNIVSPILMSLSAARNPSRKRHVRALSVCAFLICMPVSLLYYLWAQHSPSTWLLAVTAFSVEVIVKVSAGKSRRDSLLTPPPCSSPGLRFTGHIHALSARCTPAILLGETRRLSLLCARLWQFCGVQLRHLAVHQWCLDTGLRVG